DYDYLGRPVLTLALRSRATGVNLCARLVDVHPDGTATRVAFGFVNLTHRDGNADPKPHRIEDQRAGIVQALIDRNFGVGLQREIFTG
ncbi:CocE/NonD family hydrolase C-terminal non-catalytic domain-containing protein, partial [Rhizobium ruizarguesonis]